MPLASHDTNACITWPKRNVAPHFNNHDITNTIGLVMMSSVSHDTNAGANGNTVSIFQEGLGPQFIDKPQSHYNFQ